MEALEPFSCPAPVQDPPVLPYLVERRRRTFDVQVQADIIPAGMREPRKVSSANFNSM
jgi:fumarylacetoacetase